MILEVRNGGVLSVRNQVSAQFCGMGPVTPHGSIVLCLLVEHQASFCLKPKSSLFPNNPGEMSKHRDLPSLLLTTGELISSIWGLWRCALCVYWSPVAILWHTGMIGSELDALLQCLHACRHVHSMVFKAAFILHKDSKSGSACLDCFHLNIAPSEVTKIWLRALEDRK